MSLPSIGALIPATACLTITSANDPFLISRLRPDLEPFTMNYLYSFLALDLANQRRNDIFSLEYRQTREAIEARQAAELAAAGPDRASFARLALAHGLAAVSRGSAAAVRRLDDVVADDLGRALAPGK